MDRSRNGTERVVMKKNCLIGYFVSEQQSAYYQSPAFSKVLQYVQSHPQQVKMKEKQTRTGLRLLLTFDRIDSVDKALAALEPFSDKKVDT